MASQQQNKSYVVVPKKVADWSKIEYRLQLALGTSTAVIKNMWSVSKPHLNLQYEKLKGKKSMLNVVSFVDVKSLDKTTTVEKIISEGFDIPKKGKIFSTGFFQLEQKEQSSSGTYQVLLCKVAVGKSLCLRLKKNDNLSEMIKREDMDPTFDSVYLMYEKDKDNSLYKFDYVIFDRAQVHPEYLIEFYFDKGKEDNQTSFECDFRGCHRPAVVYCLNDKMHFCHEHDREVHDSAFEVAKDHVRVPLSEKPKDFGFCKTHKSTKNQFFCTKCKEALCVYCKIKGSHSSGEFANHVLIHVDEAYTQAVNEAEVIDPLIEKHKASIKSKLLELDNRISHINRNAKKIERELKKAMEKALHALTVETQKKLDILLADQIELRRQYEEILWAENSLKYQLEVLSPQHYLTSWFRHLERKEELITTAELELGKVESDLVMLGTVTVTTEEVLKKFKNLEVDSVSALNEFHDLVFVQKVLQKDSNFSPSKSNNDISGDDLTQFEDDTRSFLTQWQKMFKVKTQKSSFNLLSQTANRFVRTSHDHYDKLKQIFSDRMLSSTLKGLFKDSEILQPGSKAVSLIYFALPFKILIGDADSKDNNGLALTRFQVRFKKERVAPRDLLPFLLDNDGRGLILLFKHQDRVFGAFTPEGFKNSGGSGNKDCFLFSVDDKRMYTHRRDPKTGKAIFCWVDSDYLGFGEKDLILEEGGVWTDCVGGNYAADGNTWKGVGKLSGAPGGQFVPDVLEVWNLVGPR